MRRTRTLALLLLAITATVTTSGCRKARDEIAEEALRKATGGAVNVDNGTVTISSPDGAATLTAGAPGALPAGFPSSIPIYPGSTVKGGIKSSDKGKDGYIVSLETKDSPQQVGTFYKGQLKAWKNTMDMNTPDMMMLEFRDPTGKLGVTITPTHNKTTNITDVGLLVATF
jgi:hypothetical protein